MTHNKPTPTDVKNDIWLMLSLAVSSNEFAALEPAQKQDIINTTKHLIDNLPTS